MGVSSCGRSSGFRFASPGEAVDALCAELAHGEARREVGVERVALGAARGRVLAEAARADRDSPALDVSAMDGFAVRTADLRGRELPIAGVEAAIGRAAMVMIPGTAVRIVTGAPVPIGADAVIKREDVEEGETAVRFSAEASAAKAGPNIRRRGENAAVGAVVAETGGLVTSALVGVLAAVGCAEVPVRRRVRVRIITTGDELVPVAATPEAWQLRDSNGAALHALLAARAWIEVAPARHVRDEPGAIAMELRAAADEADAVFLTGGVSMGDRDFVPRVVEGLGGRVVFHKLPQRPGKPMLAAVMPTKRGSVPVLGLPGNPVSVMVTARRLGVPMLASLVGAREKVDVPPRREIAGADAGTLDLWWHRLVRDGADGRLELIGGRGSGDVVAAAGSSGFVEVPPGGSGAGPWPYYAWDA
jgi:molybdenum cofactor synthesis domain-containing protein